MEENKRPSIPVLKGLKTILRLLRESDVDTLLRWINDEEVNQFLMSRLPMHEAGEREWVSALGKSDTNIVFGIETLDGTFIGTMGLHSINWIDRTAVSGTLIGEKEYQGKGYGTDAKMTLLNFAFMRLGLCKICSAVIAFNERSLAYTRKCGYVEEGRRRAQFFRKGERHDDVIFGLFLEDWLPRYEYYQQHGTLKGFTK